MVPLEIPKDIEATQFVDAELAHGGSSAVTIPLVLVLLRSHGPEEVNAEHAIGLRLFAVMFEISLH